MGSTFSILRSTIWRSQEKEDDKSMQLMNKHEGSLKMASETAQTLNYRFGDVTWTIQSNLTPLGGPPFDIIQLQITKNDTLNTQYDFQISWCNENGQKYSIELGKDAKSVRGEVPRCDQSVDFENSINFKVQGKMIEKEPKDDLREESLYWFKKIFEKPVESQEPKEDKKEKVIDMRKYFIGACDQPPIIINNLSTTLDHPNMMEAGQVNRLKEYAMMEEWKEWKEWKEHMNVEWSESPVIGIVEIVADDNVEKELEMEKEGPSASVWTTFDDSTVTSNVTKTWRRRRNRNKQTTKYGNMTAEKKEDEQKPEIMAIEMEERMVKKLEKEENGRWRMNGGRQGKNGGGGRGRQRNQQPNQQPNRQPNRQKPNNGGGGEKKKEEKKEQKKENDGKRKREDDGKEKKEESQGKKEDEEEKEEESSPICLLDLLIAGKTENLEHLLSGKK